MKGFNLVALLSALAVTQANAGFLDERGGAAAPASTNQMASGTMAQPSAMATSPGGASRMAMSDKVVNEIGQRPPNQVAPQGMGKDISLEEALRFVVPKEYRLAYDDGVPKSVQASWQGGKPWPEVFREALTQAGYSATIDWTMRTVRVHGTNRVMMPPQPGQTAPAPQAAGGSMMGANPSVATVVAGGAPAAPAAASSSWVLNSQTMLGGVRAIANRHGYATADEHQAAKDGNKLSFTGSLRLEGTSVEDDMKAFIRAVNNDRVVAEVDIFNGNKRVLPKFYTGETK